MFWKQWFYIFFIFLPWILTQRYTTNQYQFKHWVKHKCLGLQGVNISCGRQWFRWLVRIVAPIPKQQKEIEKKKEKRRRKFTCQVSGVRCHLSPVTCHLLLTPTVTSTDPPPANSPVMHSWLVANTQKPEKNYFFPFPHYLVMLRGKTKLRKTQKSLFLPYL